MCSGSSHVRLPARRLDRRTSTRPARATRRASLRMLTSPTSACAGSRREQVQRACAASYAACSARDSRRELLRHPVESARRSRVASSVCRAAECGLRPPPSAIRRERRGEAEDAADAAREAEAPLLPVCSAAICTAAARADRCCCGSSRRRRRCGEAAAAAAVCWAARRRREEEEDEEERGGGRVAPIAVARPRAGGAGGTCRRRRACAAAHSQSTTPRAGVSARSLFPNASTGLRISSCSPRSLRSHLPLLRAPLALLGSLGAVFPPPSLARAPVPPAPPPPLPSFLSLSLLPCLPPSSGASSSSWRSCGTHEWPSAG